MSETSVPAAVAAVPPPLSDHFRGRSPSAIRQAQILFLKRPDRDRVRVVNLAIGNVSLPMHPRLLERMRRLREPGSPFAGGAVMYTPTTGTDEARQAFLNVIASAGFPTDGLGVVVTDGGSAAMELMALGVAGPGSERPILLLDPAYTNYMDMARRVGVRTVSIRRDLGETGEFGAPDLAELDRLIAAERPTAVVVIPADNPTGQFLPQRVLDEVGRMAVAHGLWLVSDEAYRQLHHTPEPASSVWGIREEAVPGITGRRISIESASKVWNACGLRIGALVTDSADFHAKAVAEYTANLSANAIGQWIFGALAEAPHDELRAWYERQRAYYRELMAAVGRGLSEELPGVIVSRPDAALYAVVDVRRIAPAGFDAAGFVAFCAEEGKVAIDGADHTLLVAPLGGFYARDSDPAGPRTQMRIAFVEPPDEMKKVPKLFAELFRAYAARGAS